MDVFNGLVALIVPVIAVIVVVQNAFGGNWDLVGETARSAFPEINDASAFGHTYDPINILSMCITGVIATFASPHIVSKLYMSKDRKTFQKMTYTGSIAYTVMGLPIIMLGVIGVALYKEVLGNEASDMLIPTMMLEYTNTFIVIAMLWVLFAFATSTTNAFTLSGASIISKDLIGRYGFKNIFDPAKKERISVNLGKIGVIVIVIITIIASLTRPAYLVDYAYSSASPGFAQALPAMLLGMYWKRATKEGAWAGTVGELITLFITLFVVKSPLGVNPVMWALGVNFLLFFVVSFFTKPPMDVVKDFFPMPESAPSTAEDIRA